jgi:hypothetical protein
MPRSGGDEIEDEMSLYAVLSEPAPPGRLAGETRITLDNRETVDDQEMLLLDELLNRV